MEVLATVGGSLLSSSVEMLFDKLKLESSELMRFARKQEVYTELMKWKTMLLKIKAVLEDAEEKQMTDRLVKIWLGELRDLAYDVEDILDEFETEALRRKMEAEPQASTSKVRKLIPTCCTGFSPSAVKFNVKMGSKIKGIATRLEEITRQKDVLELREIAGRRANRASERLPTTSLVNEADVYGRKKDAEAIVELLLSGEASNAKVSVIPIQGMGGLGKTTLAQLVYNNARVTDSFDLKEWVCVSDVFNVFQISKTILQQESFDAKDLNSLQVKLKEKLFGKKFFIVLDDVWDVNYENWTVLCAPFEAGAPGSRIIVTTRIEDVSSTVGTIPAYLLKQLSNDDCLSVFSQHALGEKNFDAHPNLREVGQAIVERCDGLPLAAKVLGGLLHNKPNRDEWEDVLHSKIWDIPQEKCGILPALRLSYHHLPSHLKRCFAYCAMFPKDYEFDKDELILLWMAEGFLQQPKGKKRMEDIGRSYFRGLQSRSFFQQSSSNNSRFVMHDLIHDLAQSIFGEICFHYEYLQGNKQPTSFEKVRYSSFNSNHFDVWQRFNIFYKMESLRTFAALRRPFVNNLSNKVLYDLLPKLKCLRVLSLSNYCIKELPDSIGNLKHLRQLNLSRSEIQCLPESVGALYNLQTLILYGCNRLTKLPSSIGNLINLYHLDISETNRLKEMPLGIAQLTNLHKLTKFIVGKGDGLGIRELKKLPHLCGQLSILGLDNVVDIRAAKDADLKNKQGLDELVLEWIDDFNDSRNDRDEMLVLDSLQPHEDLKKLSIAFYGGTKFPSWIGGPSFTNMVEFNLRGCRKCKSLPSLGQLPLLKVLYIQGMNAVKCVGLEFLGHYSPPNKPFKSLETLKLKDMVEWEDWSSSTGVEETSIEGFSSLRELEISNCPKLVRKLPSQLPSLIKLVISSCPLLENLPLNLPSLREMSVRECNGMVHKSMVDLSSLTTLKIKRIAGLSCLDQGLMKLLVAIELLEIEDCNELKCLWQNGAELEQLACLSSLKIGNCSQLVSIMAGNDEDLHGLTSLKSFVVTNCEALETLPDWVKLGKNSNRCLLEELVIHTCPSLKSFPSSELPTTLRRLAIRACENLETLPDWVMLGKNSNRCLLEELVIERCPSLESFPRGELPATLKILQIKDCRNLVSLPEGMMHDDNDGNNTSQLEKLSIGGCSSLTSFPVGKFPATLQSLEIWNCMQSESLLERMPQNSTTLGDKSLPPLQCLTRLEISGCSVLESFPEMGLSIPNLKSFVIYDCVNLKSLPNQMHNLTALRHLTISNCPGFVSFPEGGLPPNLVDLDIWSCENLKQPMMEWGLHTLSSLRRFTLGNTCPPDIVSFPDDECLVLPTALASIHIANRNNLESISKGIQNLTSLEFLVIHDCPKLRSLPKEGLPASLGYLSIRGCPLLKERCLKDQGEYWSILTDIPCVNIQD